MERCGLAIGDLSFSMTCGSSPGDAEKPQCWTDNRLPRFQFFKFGEISEINLGTLSKV